jgi:hypothetical protein
LATTWRAIGRAVVKMLDVGQIWSSVTNSGVIHRQYDGAPLEGTCCRGQQEADATPRKE